MMPRAAVKLRTLFTSVLIAASPLSSAAAAHIDDVQQHRVDHIFAAFDRPDSPGCAMGAIRDGRFVYRRGYGMASLELGVPISPQTVFYVGSVSKQFTAASVIIAAEQGLLSLDDDVHRFIPELPDYGHPVTLRQMLHHTSGLRDYYGIFYFAARGYDHFSAAETLELVLRQRSLNFAPGSQYSYSNTNYLLLAEVIERATGKSLAQFADENIFRPLGMTHTRFYDDSGVVVPNRAMAYEPGPGGAYRVGWSSRFDTVGAGGLLTTVDDLLLWDRNFYQNRLGTGDFLTQMLTRGRLSNGTELPMAAGLLIDTYRGAPVVDFNGALFSYRAAILRFPRQRFTAIVLCNAANANVIGLSRQVADAFIGSELAPAPNASGPAIIGGQSLSGPSMNGQSTVRRPQPAAPPSVDPASLAEYTGYYSSDEVDTTYRVVQDGDHLVLQIHGVVVPLTFVGGDEFANREGARIRFRRDGAGAVSGLTATRFVMRFEFDRTEGTNRE